MATDKSEKKIEASSASGAFARDLGYLFPFLDRLAAHAASATGSNGERLRELVEGERDRWEQIRALLSGEGEDAAAGGNAELETGVETDVGVEAGIEKESEAADDEALATESSPASADTPPAARVEVRSTPPASSLPSAQVPPPRPPIGRHFTVGPLKPARSKGLQNG